MNYYKWGKIIHMYKKISIIITLCLALTTQCFAFSDTQSSKMADAVDKLSALGIVSGYEDGTFRPDAPVTRAEFIAMLNRSLGIKGDTLSGDSFLFSDVDKAHWAAGDIEFGVGAGYISGYGDKTFRPDSNITYAEIIKMLVSAVGYSPMAEENGGYPDGYNRVANQLGFLRGVSFGNEPEATRGNTAQLLYAAMQVEVVEPSYGRELTYKRTNKTLMDKLLELEKLSSVKGIVTKTKKTGLKGEGLSRDNQVCIDDIVYDTGAVDLEPFLGMWVEAFYYTGDGTDIPVITSVNPINNTFIEIKAEDFEKVQFDTAAVGDVRAGFIEYGGGKKEDLSSNLSVVYNGKAMRNFTADDIKTINGKITLIENSRDSLYDVIFIEESFSVVVDRVSVATEVIFLKSGTIGEMTRIMLDSEDSDFYFSIHDKEGNSLNISDLKENDIINVRSDKSATVIDITVHTEKIEGVVTEYNSDDNEIVINEKMYKIAKDEKGAPMITPDLKTKGIYYADANDEIVYFEEGELILDGLGLVEKVEGGSGLSSGFMVRLITGGIIRELTDKSNNRPYAEVGNRDWTVYEAESRIRFNGSATSAKAVAPLLKKGDLVKYSVTSAGKISVIDVWTPDTVLNDKAYNPEIKSFGGEFYIDKSTAVFCVPTNRTTGMPVNTAADEDYFVNITLNSGAVNGYDITAFNIDEDTQVAKAVVIWEEMIADQPGRITNSTGITIVTKLRSMLENDGQVLLLEGFSNGKEISEIIKAEARVYTIAKELKFGDVIYMSKNSQGFVDNIEFVESFGSVPSYFHKDKRLETEKIFGKLHTIKRNRLDRTSNVQVSAFTINLGTSEAADHELVETRVDTKVMPSIYMIDSGLKKITVITVDDLYSTEELGYDRASDVFICKKKYDVKGIIILK